MVYLMLLEPVSCQARRHRLQRFKTHCRQTHPEPEAAISEKGHGWHDIKVGSEWAGGYIASYC